MSTEVIRAIQAGDEARVRALAAVNPTVAAERDDAGVSALLLATYHRAEGMVEALRPGKPDLDVFEAAALGDVERLRELLDADPAAANATAPDGFHPLALAAFFGRPDAVRLLLERGADVRARGTGAIRTTALEAAAAADETAIARLLLDAGADPASAQPGGFTPLHAAAQNRNRELYDLLVARGADPAARADDGRAAAWG